MSGCTNRKGVTLIEVAIVVGLVGILTGIVYPSLASALTKASSRSAQSTVVAQLALARSAAVQRGRPARLVLTGTVLHVAIDSAGTLLALGGGADVYALYGASIASTRSIVEFDPRGMAAGLTGPVEYTLTQGSTVKHICVRRLGNIVMQACSA